MSKQAINYGAEGIGLCRTEHMFFDEGRIDLMRRMILAATEKERRASLKKLLPYQRRDFRGLFQSMAGRPVTIRLLDPPLHEFLPGDLKLQREMAKRLDMSLGEVKKRMDVLHEENPMLGCRGCRLGILYPEITEMQVRAIFEAAKQVMLKDGNPPVRPEIMVPLVGFSSELADQVSVVRRVAEDVMKESGVQIDYQVGTMIEVPRAVVTAAEIAEVADFFSFGTNDLTQMTLGLSRDDMGTFFESYTQKEIYDSNPFVSIDESGVGRLILYAVEQGKSARSDLKLGICGEHGGDPASIAFCHGAGLDYVSCSPPRVPVARLAAAQAALIDPS
jgi:pyruvate,orthophosphate dikinase